MLTSSRSTSAAALVAAACLVLASSSSAAPADVECLDATAALGMDECLTPGYAICSPSPHGGWAFGIDPVDGRVKLWEGERVSQIKSS